MTILPFYAAMFALLFVGISVRTLRLRRRLRIAIGDGGNETMLRAMRVHANFAEYVPLCLLMIFLVEQQVPQPGLVHALCLFLLAGRVAHALGVSRPAEDYRYRVFGMAMTLTTLVGCAGFLLFAYARHLVP